MRFLPPRPPLFLLLLVFGCKEAPKKPPEDPAATSREAFLGAYAVFMHPRCVNCHPAGDAPLVGEDSRVHPQNVKRGPDGLGLYALKCASCHQARNLPGENMPPGSRNWHLPPPETPMVFEGRTPKELALQLKDGAATGGKSLEEIVKHVEEDSLVKGGWDPGDGRAKPPISHEEFVALVREWVLKGAAVPE
jgi:mono/diheme cytochrome c family protein